MSNDTSTTSKASPAFRIYAINKRPGRKTQWVRIGAAWPHEDGKGFGLDFGAKPLAGSDIALRVPAESDETPSE